MSCLPPPVLSQGQEHCDYYIQAHTHTTLSVPKSPCGGYWCLIDELSASPNHYNSQETVWFQTHNLCPALRSQLGVTDDLQWSRFCWVCTLGSRWCASWWIWPWPVPWRGGLVSKRGPPPYPDTMNFTCRKTSVSPPTPHPCWASASSPARTAAKV